MDEHTYIAFDLGAESGRTILGTLKNRQLSIQEVTRFPNEMVTVGGHLHWDIDRLFQQMRKGLAACVSVGAKPLSIGVDTWGVDFGLFGPDGSALELPYSYRDHRTDGMMEEFFKLVPRKRVYELTGIQFMQLNSLFQLFAAKRQDPILLEKATRLLFMPDIFNYLFTGLTKTEFTFATTSQLYNPRAGAWEGELFSALGVPRSIMQEIVAPGTVLGRVKKAISAETSIGGVWVVAVASHDTGSAIAAIPAEGDDWLYISSGTWSLMGIETRQPIITRDALELNFTNEGGVEGTFRFLKNITGLWLLQQCRKTWSQAQQYSYDDLTKLIGQAAPFRSLVDTDYPAFFNPPSMPEAIRQYCRETDQPSPESHADFVRCILESLALKYRATLDQLRRLNPRAMSRIHLIGGGAQNGLLCQFTANATGLPVLVGPIEATATGNIMVQALASGDVQSLADMRKTVRDSFQSVSYEPREVEAWESAYLRYRKLTAIGQRTNTI
jgi:rhamnulokinase